MTEEKPLSEKSRILLGHIIIDKEDVAHAVEKLKKQIDSRVGRRDCDYDYGFNDASETCIKEIDEIFGDLK